VMVSHAIQEDTKQTSNFIDVTNRFVEDNHGVPLKVDDSNYLKHWSDNSFGIGPHLLTNKYAKSSTMNGNFQ